MCDDGGFLPMQSLACRKPMITEEQNVIRTVQVKNEHGLHTRPATMIVRLLQDVKSEVFFSYNNETINAKSVLSILILAAPKNACITINTKGEDAEEVMSQIVEIFEDGFGEVGAGAV